jgi:hypothetical protein
MKTLPRILLMAYHKKQNVYRFIPAGSALFSFCVCPFVLWHAAWHNTEFMFVSFCAPCLTFDMKVIFQMFEESLQRT